MKRRSFLKLLGVTISAPSLINADMFQKTPVWNVSNEALNGHMITIGTSGKGLTTFEKIEANCNSKILLTTDEYNSYSKDNIESILAQARSKNIGIIVAQQDLSCFIKC